MDPRNDNPIEEEEEFGFQYRQRMDSYSNILQSPQQLFSKIDCIVTLGEFNLDSDENLLNNIQIEQPEIKDFHLTKFFNEEQKLPLNYAQRQPEHEHKQKPPRKESASLPSFTEELEMSAANLIDRIMSFQELHKFYDALKNIDNFTFLEQTMKQPLLFKSFQQQYSRTIQKIKLYKQQQRLDVKQLISFICSIGIDLISEMVNLVARADSSQCFEIMKEEGYQKPKQQEIPIIPQCESIPSSLETDKKSRKAWTKKELIILQNFINTNQNGQMTNAQIQDLAQSLGRTWYSVQSKLQKMKRNDIVNDSQQQLFSNQAQRLESSQQVKMEKGQKSTKYEYTVEDMIRFSLQQLQGKGSKMQIIDQINQQFFNGQLNEESACWRSITITLASVKSSFIRKVKGTFSLMLNLPEQMEDDNKMRNKLAWILKNSPQKKATLRELVEIYVQGQGYDEFNLKRLQKQINQTLRQSTWFDKSQAKTMYVLES